MILHYLKVALRNLWKYRTHSLISVLCLAIGITFFTVMSMYVSRVGFYRDQPDYERRVHIKKKVGWMTLKDWELLKNIPLPELDSLAATSYYSSQTEIGIIDRNGREMPYMAHYKEANGRSFTDFALKRVSGDTRMLKKDEVVISRDFARRAFGKEDPLGMTLHWMPRKEGEIEFYRIVGVVDGFFPVNGNLQNTDIYFPLSALDGQALYVESVLKPGMDIHRLNERLKQIQLDPTDENSTLEAHSTLSRYEGNIWTEAVGYFIAALVLISGIVNFLKFVIQMFYNRQRELAIRKCVGSGTGGTFCLLFAECFCMMSVALFLSMCISELTYTFLIYYVPEQMSNYLNLPDIYITSLKVYLVVLAVCMLIILWPVWKLRRTSIIRMVMVGSRRHVFRNVMIGVQMAISLFFLGATCVLGLILDERNRNGVDYLTEEEEERTVVMKVNSGRLSKNLTAVLTDIKALPEVAEQMQMTSPVESRWQTKYPDKEDGYVVIIEGSARYFDFFRIPMEGKVMDDEEGHQRWAYVSRDLMEQMQKDSIGGSIHLNSRDLQIAGVYDRQYKEEGVKRVIGSAFICSKYPGVCYFRISPQADVRATMEKIEAVCRKYVPESLPLDIRLITDKRGTKESLQNTVHYGFGIMAFISLLVVMLSIYSAISMDTVSRQKEVAIRKINGATPKVIAWMFGRTYIIAYLIAFLLVYPLSRAMLIIELGGDFNVPYRWDWPLFIFFGMALLIFLVTAFKIWQIMHINPATIIKKE